MNYTITPTADALITLDEVKAHCFIHDDSEDELLQLYIHAACERFTEATGFIIPESEVVLKMDGFSEAVIRIMRGPVSEVTEITYVAPGGDLKSINPHDVTLDKGRVSRLFHKSGRWPVSANQPGAVTIKITAGHNKDTKPLPKIVRWAILTSVAHMYEHREPVVTGITVSKIPDTVEMVIDMFEIKQVL